MSDAADPRRSRLPMIVPVVPGSEVIVACADETLPPAALAIFVKTPGLSPVKTRLAAGIGAFAAMSFYQLATAATAEVARDPLPAQQALGQWLARTIHEKHAPSLAPLIHTTFCSFGDNARYYLNREKPCESNV